MANPFQVPGTGPGSREPLCPWREPRHIDYYVRVDQFGEAMAKFEQQIASLMSLPADQRLSEEGAVVVATGGSGCGKTSLLHWCADRLDAITNRVGGAYQSGALIVDHSKCRYPQRVRRSEECRVEFICQETFYKLRRQNAIDWPDELGEALDARGYRLWYDQLASHAAKRGIVLIVVLPPVVDFVEELNIYYHLVHNCGRIVFLTESSEAVIEDHLEGESRCGSETVWLQVGPIRETDGWLLVDNRLRQVERGAVAQVAERDINRTVRYMLSQKIDHSVRRLGCVLYGAWDAHRDESPPGRVTAQELRAQLGRPHPVLPFRRRA